MAHIEITSEDQFKKDILSSDVPVVIDFWAEWCGPCKMLNPILDELIKTYDKVLFAKLNVDDLPKIASDYGVQSIPTIIVMKAGKEVERIVGVHDKDKYIQILNNL